MITCARPILSFATLLACLVPLTDGVAQEAREDARGSPPTCLSGERVGSGECTPEAYLLAILERQGVEAAMAELERLVASDQDIQRDAHSYSHAIGISAYTGVEDVGEVFARCTPAYQSGCYHGVIQSYFTQQSAGEVDSAAVNALCRALREDPNERWLLFQCAHGMGHGLLMIADRHLPTSLQGCDLVEMPWEREACYGGAFMENIVGATAPHHAVGRPAEAAHAEHGAPQMAESHQHGHGTPGDAAAATPEEFPPLKAEDPLYPCSVLEDRYLIACYQMQTSAILHFNGYDIREAARTCQTAPELLRPTCFQSLGRDVSAVTLQDHGRAIQLCGLAGEDYERWCHLGYAKNLVDLTADSNDGLRYCRLLADGESKRFCYIAVGEQIWVLTQDTEQRVALCANAEEAYLDECRRGAGLEQGN
ncbi:MAG: hypothetical protein WD737_09295 [Gemmatimonadota bacterium]